MSGAAKSGARPVLVVMAKEPVPGRVKTRLAPALGQVRAAELAAELLAITLDNARAGWPGEILLCGSWEGRCHRLRQQARARGLDLVRQRGDGLARRMIDALRHGLERGPAAAIIGSDIPGLEPHILGSASRRLAAGLTVVGPSTDGGFYLLGVRGLDERLFYNASFGHRRVLRDLTGRLARTGNPVGCFLPELRDIDTPGDLEWAAGAFARLSRFSDLSVTHA